MDISEITAQKHWYEQYSEGKDKYLQGRSVAELTKFSSIAHIFIKISNFTSKFGKTWLAYVLPSQKCKWFDNVLKNKHILDLYMFTQA